MCVRKGGDTGRRGNTTSLLSSIAVLMSWNMFVSSSMPRHWYVCPALTWHTCSPPDTTGNPGKAPGEAQRSEAFCRGGLAPDARDFGRPVLGAPALLVLVSDGGGLEEQAKSFPQSVRYIFAVMARALHYAANLPRAQVLQLERRMQRLRNCVSAEKRGVATGPDGGGACGSGIGMANSTSAPSRLASGVSRPRRGYTENACHTAAVHGAEILPRHNTRSSPSL